MATPGMPNLVAVAWTTSDSESGDTPVPFLLFLPSDDAEGAVTAPQRLVYALRRPFAETAVRVTCLVGALLSAWQERPACQRWGAAHVAGFSAAPARGSATSDR